MKVTRRMGRRRPLKPHELPAPPRGEDPNLRGPPGDRPVRPSRPCDSSWGRRGRGRPHHQSCSDDEPLRGPRGPSRQFGAVPALTDCPLCPRRSVARRVIVGCLCGKELWIPRTHRNCIRRARRALNHAHTPRDLGFREGYFGSRGKRRASLSLAKAERQRRERTQKRISKTRWYRRTPSSSPHAPLPPPY